MREIHSYVIRVYRRDSAEALAGLVEDVQGSRTAPFQSLAELCELLSGQRRFARRRPVRRAASTTSTTTPAAAAAGATAERRHEDQR